MGEEFQEKVVHRRGLGAGGGGEWGSGRQVWERYRPREELGDGVSVFGGPSDGGELGRSSDFGFLGRKTERLGASTVGARASGEAGE